MKTVQIYLPKIITTTTIILLFLTPLFFLPLTRDFVLITKLHFFLYGICILLFFSLLQFFFSRKIVFQQNIFINSLLLLIVSVLFSFVFMSPNKPQALFSPYNGLLILSAFIVYYLYLTYSLKNNLQRMFVSTATTGLIVSLWSIFFSIPWVKKLGLPANIVGSPFDIIIFLGFIVIFGIVYLYHNKTHTKTKLSIFIILSIALTVIALLLQLYEIGKALFVTGTTIILPPWGTSWSAAVEILKNPWTALFGVGIGNFTAIFSKVKTLEYNASEVWNITSFYYSRSAFLHYVTELGLIGLGALGFLTNQILAHAKKVPRTVFAIILYAICCFLFFPPSFILLYIFFTSLVYFSLHITQNQEKEHAIDLKQWPLVYFIATGVYILLLTGVLYVTTNVLTSEILFKQSLDAIQQKDIIKIFQFQKDAIIKNPYNEELRKAFSQTNLIIATNLAQNDPKKLTIQQKDTFSQTAEGAVREAKAAVSLNPNDPLNWEYLAFTYKNLINLVPEADVWAVRAYQQVILLDSQNPVHRLELGRIYYFLKNYDDAQEMFEQAITLKPDWVTPHYNLAWTFHSQEKYTEAVQQMEQAVSLIDKKTTPKDYQKAQKDLDEFKKKVPNQPPVATSEETLTP